MVRNYKPTGVRPGPKRKLPKGSRDIGLGIEPDLEAALESERQEDESLQDSIRRVLRKALGLPAKIPRDGPPGPE